MSLRLYYLYHCGSHHECHGRFFTLNSINRKV
nr:MAG TPA: hypothetical protein [Caudoviricetes sp.]